MIHIAKKILIVDDEPSIIKGLKYSLEQDGYSIDAAQDGEEALSLFSINAYDLVLLDIMLPKLSGIEVCQRMRENSNVPIMMLTAKGEDMDKIMGLEYGADDYMTKPFNILELKARIKTILRRASPVAEADKKQLSMHQLTLNLSNRTCYLGDKEINLTAKEFDLLQLFMTNKGVVYGREELLDIIWKDNYSGDLRTVDVHIRRLREKIEKNPSQPELIFTKWGVGYYFTDK